MNRAIKVSTYEIKPDGARDLLRTVVFDSLEAACSFAARNTSQTHCNLVFNADTNETLRYFPATVQP